jgi:hypothetical protein
MQFSYCSSRWCLQQLICFKRVNNEVLLRGTCKSQAIFLFAGRRLLVTCIRIPSHRPITFPAVTGTDVHVRSSSEQYSQDDACLLGVNMIYCQHSIRVRCNCNKASYHSPGWQSLVWSSVVIHGNSCVINGKPKYAALFWSNNFINSFIIYYTK